MTTPNTETETERLARTLGVAESDVARTFGPDPALDVPDLDELYEQWRRAYSGAIDVERALNDADGDAVYAAAESALLDDDRHEAATPEAKLRSERGWVVAQLAEARGALGSASALTRHDLEAKVRSLEAVLAQVDRELAAVAASR
jgi:hypothetical protein